MPLKLGAITAYNLEELSKKLKVHVATLRNYIRSGKLQATKVGRRYYVSEEALQKMFQGESK